MSIDKNKIERGIRLIIEALGEDPEREGLRDTPNRIARMWESLLKDEMREGQVPARLFQIDTGKQLVLIKGIRFIGICEHHLLPFIGKAHIAYLPEEGRVAGLSTIVRWTNSLAKRLQLQEQLTNDLASRIMEELRPKGVLVIIEAEHLCHILSGTEQANPLLITKAVRGSSEIQAEALTLMNNLG